MCYYSDIVFFVHCNNGRYSFHIKLEVKVLITYIVHFMFVGCFNLMTLNCPGWPPGPLLYIFLYFETLILLKIFCDYSATKQHKYLNIAAD